MDILITTYFFVIGSALGSFSLVLAWRMHDKKDWVKGRSKCDNCKKTLQTKDLIPVVSWLLLKGKCRYCNKAIPSQTIKAELLLGTILATSWYFWPYQLSSISGYLLFIVWMVVAVLLSALFWYDMRWLILPTKLIKPLVVLAVLFCILRGFAGDFSVVDTVIMPLLGAGLLFGIFFILNYVSNGKWIGFGDVRLAIPLGLLIGSPLLSWLMLFTASCIGIVFAMPALITKSKKLSTQIPFGPMLILATIIIILWGQIVVDKYLAISGL